MPITIIHISTPSILRPACDKMHTAQHLTIHTCISCRHVRRLIVYDSCMPNSLRPLYISAKFSLSAQIIRLFDFPCLKQRRNYISISLCLIYRRQIRYASSCMNWKHRRSCRENIFRDLSFLYFPTYIKTNKLLIISCNFEHLVIIKINDQVWFI